MCELGLGTYMIHYTSAFYPTIHVVLPTAKYPRHLTVGTKGRPKVLIHWRAYIIEEQHDRKWRTANRSCFTNMTGLLLDWLVAIIHSSNLRTFFVLFFFLQDFVWIKSVCMTLRTWPAYYGHLLSTDTFYDPISVHIQGAKKVSFTACHSGKL